jgi:hypothetical protein
MVKNRRSILEEHIRLFKDELDFIGSVKPLLIVFGNDADEILRLGIDPSFRMKRFHAVVKILHYNSRGSDAGYKEDTRLKLAPYITIP